MPNIHDTIALFLHANNDKLEDRTAVQKMVYFYAQLSSDAEIPKYDHHFYGPFSQGVAEALDDMSEFSFIDEDVVSRYYETYTYKLTEKGKEYAEKAKKNNPEDYKLISKIVAICKKHSDLQSTPLSYAAKSHYILNNSKEQGGNKYTIQEIRQTAKDFDWEITSHDAETGIELLKELGLVS